MSRLIDADALKDWLEIVPLTGDGGVDINDLVEHIDLTPTAREWIPCSERTPKEEGEYICTMEDGQVQECGFVPRSVNYKLTALVNELEEIFAHIRERNEDDSVCGLCEYDGAYIGPSGDWCNECPGFDKADCFKLKDKIREEWVGIDG